MRDAVVFRADHLDRRVVIQRDADGVGAYFQVAPLGTGHKAHVVAAGDDLRRAEYFQQVAGAVSQHDQKLCAFDELEHLVHDWHSGVQEQLVFRADAGQHALVDMAALATAGVYARGLASFPRLGDGRPDFRAHLVLIDKLRPEFGHFSKVHVQSPSPSIRPRTSSFVIPPNTGASSKRDSAASNAERSVLTPCRAPVRAVCDAVAIKSP